MGIGESGEGEADEQQLPERGGIGDPHQRGVVAARAPERNDSLQQAYRQRQRQRVMPGFDDHFWPSCWPAT